jgi:hypothetical protein
MLKQMRASSSSGSTGIGRIMQVEFEAFGKALRNVDNAQSPPQLKRNLLELRYHLDRFGQAEKGMDPDTGKPQAQAASAPALPAGWTIKP